MKKLFATVISIMALVIGSLFFCAAPTRAYAANESTNMPVISQYLVNDGGPYISNVEGGVGAASGGYGDIELNKPATIYANAFDGFKLVGWYIIYTDRQVDELGQHPTKFLTEAGRTEEVFGEGGNEVTTHVELKFGVSEFGAKYDGSITIENVGENLQISPVFDFKNYYHLNVSNFFNIIDGLNNLTEYNAYYTQQEGEYYLNTIVNVRGEYFYIGKTKANEGKLYSVHSTLEVEPKEQLIDVSTGGIRRGQQLDLNFNIKNRTYNNFFETDSTVINYDINAAQVIGNSGSVDLTQNLTPTQTEEGVTKAISLKFTFDFEADLNLDEDKTAKLNLTRDRLFLVEFVPYLNGVELQTTTEVDEQTDARNLILGQMQIEQFYYEFTEQDGQPSYRFLIKEAADNNGLSATVVYANSVYFEHEGKRYNYYSFVSATLTDFSHMLNDSRVSVNYASYLYNVNFAFALKTNEGVSILNNMQVEPSMALGRGQTPDHDITKTELSDNLGYNFVGYAQSLDEAQSEPLSNSLSKDEIKIDYTYPQDITIYMVFSYIDYSIKLTGLNSKHLTNKETEIYPLTYITLQADGVNERQDKPTEDVTFSNKLHIVDAFSFNFVLNNGFVLNSFAGEQPENNTINFDVESLAAKLDVDSTEIEFNLDFDFVNYSMEYSLAASMDEALQKQVLMGDIEIELSAEVTGQDEATITLGDTEDSSGEGSHGRISATLTKTDNLLTISLDGLHLYDVVKLIAKPNAKPEGDVNYQFNRFLENNLNTLVSQQLTDSDGGYFADYTILSNKASIRASFLVPTTLFEILTDINAISYNKITVENNNLTRTLPSSWQIEKINTGRTVVTFNSYEAGGVNFGYIFENATMENDNVNLNINKGDSKITIEFSLGEDAKYSLKLEFKQVEYKIAVVQKNADINAQESWQDKKVQFDGQEYTTLSVSNLELEFSMPEGYFANRLYCGELQFEDIQTNSTLGNAFNFTFTVQQLENLVKTANVDKNSIIEINVEYIVHTYTLTINFAVNSNRPQYDNLVLSNLPTLSALADGVQVESTREKNSYVYSNIAYNTQLTLSVTGGIRAGLAGEGWFNKFGAPLSSENLIDNNLSITLTGDAEYMYSLVYKVYNVHLIKEQTQDLEIDKAGDPTSLVEGELSQQIQLFNTLSIRANAHKENGYTYNSIYYFSAEGGQINEEFAPSLDINSFDVLNMLVKRAANGEEYVEFYVSYKQLDITKKIIYEVNSNVLQEFESEFGFVDVRYNMLRYDNGAFVEDNSDTPLHYRDLVEMYIDFRTILGSDYGRDLGEINFKDGVSLNVFIGDELIQFIDNPLCDRYISFNVNSALKHLSSNNEITIKLSFTVQQKNLTFTTNVSDPTFYKEGDTNHFLLTVHTQTSDTPLPNAENNFETEFPFLTSSELRFVVYRDVYLQNLIVNGVNAYKQVQTEHGTSWEPASLEDVGATVHYANGQVDYITYYYLGTAKLELVVQPNIEDDNFHSSRRANDELYTHELQEEDQNGIIVKTHVFYGDYIFINPKYNASQIIVGYHQLGLTVGQAPENNIQLNSFIASFANLKYFRDTLEGEQEIPLEQVVDVGSYRVQLAFNDEAPLWLKQMGFGSYNIRLMVRPISLTVGYDGHVYVKEYSGVDGHRINKDNFRAEILPHLVFNADNCLDINLNGEIADTRTQISLNYYVNNNINQNNLEFSRLDSMEPVARISTIDEFDTRQPYQASDAPYNIFLQNLNLSGNKNFTLVSEATLVNAAKIEFRTVYLQNLHFRDKVFDGTNAVSVDNRYRCYLSDNVVDNYNTQLDINNLIRAHFDGNNASDVGEAKPIALENLNDLLEYILGSEVAKNYILKLYNSQPTASIYPDKISVEVEGYGAVSLINMLGKTDPNKAGLIPFNATLSVDTIKADTAAYNRIYRYIAGSLKNKKFVVGYKLVTNFQSNELFLQLPKPSRLNSVVHLSNNNDASALNYTVDGNIIIDLRQVDAPNLFIVIKNRALLTWWQILLIVLAVLLIVAIIITIVLVRRRQKLKKYKEHDKI